MTENLERPSIPTSFPVSSGEALLPMVSRLSRSERFQLIQLLIQELAEEAERVNGGATESPGCSDA